MILFVVVRPDSGHVLANLLRACARVSQEVSCFFTNDGVLVLEDTVVLKAVQEAKEAIVCLESWRALQGAKPCPTEEGSQTQHSRLIAEATAVVSL